MIKETNISTMNTNVSIIFNGKLIDPVDLSVSICKYQNSQGSSPSKKHDYTTNSVLSAPAGTAAYIIQNSAHTPDSAGDPFLNLQRFPEQTGVTSSMAIKTSVSAITGISLSKWYFINSPAFDR